MPLDVAVVAVGDPAAYEAAIAALAPRGRLVVFSGLLPADDAALHVSLSAVHYHEHTFVGAYGCSFRHGVEALDLLAERPPARRRPDQPSPAAGGPRRGPRPRRPPRRHEGPPVSRERNRMTPDDSALRAFGADIQRLIDGRDLTRERTYELFRQVLLGEQPDLQQGALLAALVAKGETPEEIAGAWQAIVEFDTVPAALASLAARAAARWSRTPAPAWTRSRPSTSARPRRSSPRRAGRAHGPARRARPHEPVRRRGHPRGRRRGRGLRRGDGGAQHRRRRHRHLQRDEPGRAPRRARADPQPDPLRLHAQHRRVAGEPGAAHPRCARRVRRRHARPGRRRDDGDRLRARAGGARVRRPARGAAWTSSPCSGRPW